MAKSRTKKAPQLRWEHTPGGFQSWCNLCGGTCGKSFRKCSKCGQQYNTLALLSPVARARRLLEREDTHVLRRPTPKRSLRGRLERARSRGVAAARARKAIAFGRKVRRDL